ncbi:dipeptide/oligopeptide/nickel ABC transporter permease/ATP-binding protein [Yinghuangia seranimata]|uniref:dipeptide/oligopeptide/nickel ABC transporter permease/ATP-binding protein n=1 Tax=Yinghuangia seranimata TaxID=408067 RepID=UPI00248CB4CD|nr:dipeptide/oligopeptide/nickel ABC transporter permease/ATP-binding protein [Yinghuangia seranimata]MDI2126576.1 dipeptide/oligopeptide/nickel ABC transporter permease/ATP-binding protein [Yinghuangia seranimata]
MTGTTWWRALLRDRNGLLGLVLVGTLVVAAGVSWVWTPYDPATTDLKARWVLPLRDGHLLGTDMLGRDQFSLLLAGARETLAVAVLATAIASVVGVALALAATLPTRWVSASVAQLVDVVIAFPALLTAMILAAVFGGSLWTAATAVGIASGVHVARVARAEIDRVRGTDYVLAATAAGSGTWRTVRRHVLPNIASTLIVQLSLVMSVASLTEAMLAYLGYGSPAPAVSWGRMLYDQQPYIEARPLLVVWPGLAVALSVLGFNLLGDALRDATDPKVRGAKAGSGAAVGAGSAGRVGGGAQAAGAAGAAVDHSSTGLAGDAVLPVLDIRGLTVRINGRTVVDEVDLSLAPGERVGLIGESGSGKSLTALAVPGLLPDGAEASGSIRLAGRELLGLRERELARVRGDQVAVVFQEPSTALDPLRRVGAQIAEPLRLHRGMTRRQAAAEAVELVRRVGLPDPEHAVRSWPHQLSGGQRQRVGIAIALACRPAVLIADEPTTALDVTVQREILGLLDELTREEETALLFITHDLAVVAGVADRVAVMRGGRLIEEGTTEEVVRAPREPYTKDLLAAARATAFDPTGNAPEHMAVNP